MHLGSAADAYAVVDQTARLSLKERPTALFQTDLKRRSATHRI